MDNLTIIVPYRNGQETIGRLLASIPPSIPALVVDDLSDTPADTDMFMRLDKRRYFSGAVNAGIKATESYGTDVLILNQDSWLEGDTWLAQVRGWQTAGYAIAGDGVMKHPAWPKGYVQGTCMYMSRAAINKVGLLNERDYPLWGATAEWQLRACRLGFKAFPCEVQGFHHAEGRGKRFGDSITAALKSEPNHKEWFIRTPPAISVIVPCYNYGRYLSDALNSLLGGPTCLGPFTPQTFQSFEVIIVDDKSTDDSWKIAKALADDWKAIRAIRNPSNVGTAATINAGVKAAHGKYITVLSADDMMETKRLETLYRASEANPHSVIYDDLYLFADGKRTERLQLPGYDFDKVLFKNPMHAGIMYPRAAWQECNGYPEIMRDGREDWAFNVALGARGYCGIHLNESLYLYRREQQNRSVRNKGGNWYETYRARLRALYPNLYAGERPPMCCGSGSKKQSTPRPASKRAGASAAMAPIGSNGMVLLEYLGQQGPHTINATEPHQTYVVGGKYHFIYVDVRHVDQLVDMMEGRGPMFKRGKMPTPHLDAVGNGKVVEPQPEPIKLDIAGGIVPSVDADKVFLELAEAQEPEPIKAEKPKRQYTRKRKVAN